MKGLIRTIAGDIKPSEVKYALTHEHGFLAINREKAADIAKVEPLIERRIASEFRMLRKQGVNLFVDVTPIGYRRHTQTMLRAGERTGMHIVGTTGYYTDSAIPAEVKKMPVSRIAERIHTDLTEGMDGSTCKAGIVKVGIQQHEPTPGEKRVFLAAAEAQKQTGAPITTHCTRGIMAQFTILKEAGVSPERMALGHVEVNAWLDILRIARYGTMLLFTNFGGRDVLPEDMMIAQIVDLVKRGYLRQIMISVDMFLRTNKGRLVYRWPGGYTQIVDRVIPRLAQAGLKPSQIETIMHRNPARHLTWQ